MCKEIESYKQQIDSKTNWMNEYVNSCKEKDTQISNLREDKQELLKQLGVTKHLENELNRYKQQNQELSEQQVTLEQNLSEKEKKLVLLTEN